jgi:hypothetical protein
MNYVYPLFALTRCTPAALHWPQLGLLKSKADMYGLVATFLCLAQVSALLMRYHRQ